MHPDVYDRIVMGTNANHKISIKTASEVREEFAKRGLSISEWARAHRFSAQLVYQVLGGRKRCLRGQSHQIAVLLRLKNGLIGSVDQIDLLRSEPPAMPEQSPEEELPKID